MSANLKALSRAFGSSLNSDTLGNELEVGDFVGVFCEKLVVSFDMFYSKASRIIHDYIPSHYVRFGAEIDNIFIYPNAYLAFPVYNCGLCGALFGDDSRDGD